MDVHFYHLKKSSLQSVLPLLLSKTLQKNWRAYIVFEQMDGAKQADSLLWTFSADAFLPHGLSSDPFPQQQPILLTAEIPDDAQVFKSLPNQPDVLFLIDVCHYSAENFKDFQRVILIFNDMNQDAVQNARMAWKNWKNAGLALTYWLQNDGGQWEKMA